MEKKTNVHDILIGPTCNRGISIEAHSLICPRQHDTGTSVEDIRAEENTSVLLRVHRLRQETQEPQRVHEQEVYHVG